MRKPFNGEYPITPGRYFNAPMIANDAKYGTHKGVDWALPPGTPLYAPTSGVITWASDAQDAGLTVTINNLGSLYKHFHMSEIAVRFGQRVSEGDYIGKSGSTGNVTGPHLHFQAEVPAGNPVDPLPLLQVLGDKTEKIMQAPIAHGGDYNALAPRDSLNEYVRKYLGRDPKPGEIEQKIAYGEFYEQAMKELRDVVVKTQQQVQSVVTQINELREDSTLTEKEHKLIDALREALK